MYYKKVCEECGKVYFARFMSSKFCSKACRMITAKRNSLRCNNDEQICWRCKNACGGCSWSHNLTPVNGWKATFIKREDDELDTYKIIYCPEFIYG